MSVSAWLIMKKNVGLKVSTVVSLLKYINPVGQNTFTFFVTKWSIADTKYNRHEILLSVCFDDDSNVYYDSGKGECGDHLQKEKYVFQLS